MMAGLDLHQVALLFKVGDNAFSCFIAVKSFVFAAETVYCCIVVHDADLFKIVALTDEEVVRVVSGSDLDAAGTEILINVIIGYDGDLSADERKDERFSDEVLVSFVLGVDCHRSITEQCLGAGRGDRDISVTVLDGITDVPEMAFVLLVFDLRIGKGGGTLGAPVYYFVTAIDETLVIEIYENFLDGTSNSPRPW